MILINRSDAEQSIILATNEATTELFLTLKNDATRKIYSLELGVDVSPTPERYQLYKIETANFSTLEEGYFAYQVKDLSGEVYEVGKLYIIPAETEQNITTPETSADTIIIL